MTVCPLEAFYIAILREATSSTKRSRGDLRNYQTRVIDIMKGIWTLPDAPPGAIIALEPGAGKTVSTLTALKDLLESGHIKKPLIVAPLLVAQTVWDAEVDEWEHLTGMTCSKILGSETQRIAALGADADFYIVNKEVLPWLWKHLGRGKQWCFDMLIIDEASMLKNGKKRTMTKSLTRFGALAAARKYLSGVIELTGTPAPNGLRNLWGLAYIIDQGERLGRSKSDFEARWFNTNKYTYETTPKPHADTEILGKMKDIMFSLNPDDYATLPPLVENDIEVVLPDKVMAEYKRFKRTLVSETYDVEAVNAAVLTNKLLQFANGSLYQEDGNDIFVHDCKLAALVDLHEEMNGTPMLVAYSFKFDLDRIRKKFPKAVVLNEEKDATDVVRRWNRGEIDMLLAHPACLHPDTEVLTETRGWCRLIDVKISDRVFDGVEFVSHSGCQYSGHKDVIEVFGITMTPDHRLLVDGTWLEAKDVRNHPGAREKARYAYTTNDDCACAMYALRQRGGDTGTELSQAQSRGEFALPRLHKRDLSHDDAHADLPRVEGHDLSSDRCCRSKLRWSRDHGVARMDALRRVLLRHGGFVSTGVDAGADGCEPRLLSGELHLDTPSIAARKQANEPHSCLPRKKNAFGRTLPGNRRQQDQTDVPLGERDEPGRSCGGRPGEHLRNREALHRESLGESGGHITAAESGKAHVYDLVDCGPRSRFIVRNADGEMFVSHNSAGHGLNIQKGSNVSVWYGLNADLELFQQFNKRLWRSGQKAETVWSHRIIARGTHDENILPILAGKDAVQSQVLRATYIELHN